jgi:hypothetical protein
LELTPEGIMTSIVSAIGGGGMVALFARRMLQAWLVKSDAEHHLAQPPPLPATVHIQLDIRISSGDP